MPEQDAHPEQLSDADAAAFAFPRPLTYDSTSSLGKRKRPSDAPSWSTAPSPVLLGPSRRYSAFDPIRDSAGPQAQGHASSRALFQAPHSAELRFGTKARQSALDDQSEGRSSSASASPDDSVPPGAATSPDSINIGHTSLAGTGSERKKRQFARRTKTGCLTCRKRKKKCDEAKPICDNCARGKLTCSGYTDIHTSLDDRLASATAEHTSLQPSRGYPPLSIETTQSSMSTMGVREHPHSAHNRRYSVPWQPYPELPRSAIESYGRQPMPFGELRNPTWSLPRWSHQGSQALNMGRSSSDVTTAAPGSLLERPNAVPQSRRLSQFDSGALGGKDDALVARDRNDSAKNISVSSLPGGQAVAIESSSSDGKEKMLAGRPYPHFSDPVLRKDRATCALLLERFNEAAKRSEYTDDTERNGRLLTAVLAPLELQRRRHPVGSVGRRTVIEAPFHCDYGYNIHIGDDVVLQAKCTMLDPCKISIGSRTIIGPNVKFFGMTVPVEPKLRNGGQSLAIGSPITVEEDCFIGGGVIIMPNRTIGRGSVIGAGTVVTEDVRAGTVVAGNPMRLIRPLEVGGQSQPAQTEYAND